MDADREIKFDFFKSKKDTFVLKYHKTLALGLILGSIFVGMLTSSLNTPNKMTAPVIHLNDKSNAGYVSLVKAMHEQEELIDLVQVLDLSKVEQTIKEIQKLGFSARNIGFKDGGRLYAVGYKNFTGEISYALLSRNKNEIKISWKNVSTISVFFSKHWDHDNYPIQTIDNGKQKDIDLTIPYNDIKKLKELRELEELEHRVVKLQQENYEIKKEYSLNIVRKTVQDNPSLKGQEEEIKKYVNLIMNSSK